MPGQLSSFPTSTPKLRTLGACHCRLARRSNLENHRHPTSPRPPHASAAVPRACAGERNLCSARSGSPTAPQSPMAASVAARDERREGG